ncbi:helix-turn-helix transcriptional regulator [uncultured Desulfobacter sp.]|uniref:helix-turn-helix transcriptional regulator n=1 Tax=uncultured Desulfobacter sp. TaxID=240139 RepID=UPI002AA647C9|nr:helix-turn-helix transcriptional regulator [uncultured Desulfobacter sp.]
MEIIRPTFSKSPKFPTQTVYSLPKEFGSGSMRVDKFSSGLELCYSDLKPTRPIALAGETIHEYFGVGFNLIGHSESRLSAHNQAFSVKNGFSEHYIYPTPATMQKDIGVTHNVRIKIFFDKKTLLDFAKEDEEPFLPFLKGLQRQVCVDVQGKMAPEMQRAMNQIISCPYLGKTRALFLEGKAMELLALKLEQMRIKDKSSLRQPRINKTDSERIYYAAELLVRDPINPPDLTDLAGRIGMGRSKFYQNFKVVFGYSPMGYLRSHRLQVAKQFLRQGTHNVTEAAFAVGFNNLGYFIRAFNAEFGVTPHQVI